MKKYIFALTFIFSVLLIPSLTHAEESESTSSFGARKIMPMKAVSKIEDRKENTPEEKRALEMKRIEQMKGKDGAAINRRDILKNHIEIIVARLNAGVSRLEQIITRIESRNEKIKLAGGDVSASQKAVAQAKDEIAKAKSDIASLPKTFESVTEEATTVSTQDSAAAINSVSDSAERTKQNGANKEALMKIRAIIQSAKGHLEAARKYLMGSVVVIKNIKVEDRIKTTPASPTTRPVPTETI